jgi:hypothetical protein
MNSEQYKDRHMKLNAWVAISKSLVGEEWEELEPEERNRIGK